MSHSARVRTEAAELWASGLSHKIRNSLNAMRTHIALLEKFTAARAEPQTVAQLHKLEESVIRLEEILHEFMDFAGPSANSWEAVKVESVIREVLQFLAADLESAQIRVVEEMTLSSAEVLVDRKRLKQALLNLIVNARQAMPEGGNLTVCASLAKPSRVVIEIGDSGPGIAASDQPQIFQPFFTTRPAGIGLGLAIVKRIVEDFHSQIRFASKPGQGTTFVLSLPTARREQARRARTEQRRQRLQPASS